MKILSLSEAKMKLSQLVDDVHELDEQILITRNGRPIAVLVSPNEVESWAETASIRGDTELMQEVRFGLESVRKKGTKLYTLEELFDG